MADEARSALPPLGPADHQIIPRALSGDGRFVVFASSSSTLVANDTNNASDVFVRDRQTGLLSRVSIASDGSEGNNYSSAATISGNGRHIAFHSCSSNLDPPDTDNPCDLFIHDRELGTTVRANIGPNGEQAVAYAEHFNLSADGRYIVFNAGFMAGSYERQIWLRDRDPDANGIFDEPGTATTTQISQDTVEPFFGLFDFLDVAISPDGRYVSYNAWASAPTGASGKWLFLHDRVAMTTVRVDVPAPGRADGNWTSYSADFSGSGHLVYVSNGNNITNTEADFWYSDDVIVYDMATGVNTAVQLTHAGAPAVEYEWAPAISADGRFVAFNGVTWDYDPIENVYVVDRQTGLSYDASVRPDGSRDNDATGRPSISDDGSAIAFIAGAAMLVNGIGDPGVYVVTDVALSPPQILVSGNGGTFTVDVMVPAGVAWALTLDPPAGSGELSANTGVGPGTIDVTVYPNYDGATRELWVVLGSERVRLEQGAPPYITFINPHSGSIQGGDSIEISGMGFVPGATVTIGGIPAANVVVVNSNLITAVTPANPLGVARVTVTNANGDSYDYYFFYRDLTPPVVTHEITGTPGANGWYVSDVSVTWSYEDPESAIFVSSCVTPYVLTVDRVDAPLCRVFSDGGETFEFVELKRDTVPPALVIFPSEPETYFQGQVVPIAYDCRDDTSGIASCAASQTGTHLDTSTVGTFTFSATAVDYAGHSVTKPTNYTVKIKPVITVPEATGVYGSTATLRAMATAFGSGAPLAGRTISFFVAYVSVGTAITSATGEAVLTVPLGTLGAGNHPTHVEFAGDDSTLPLLSPGSLAIAKATPALTWATPAFIAQGVPLGSTQLNATASVPGAFGYDPGFETVLPPGTHTLTVNFAPADSANYNMASKTVTLKVKAKPVITWPTPAPITYPARVSWTQLNATADPPTGSFVYTPPPGTLLDAGTHTLSVTFTPANTADYVSESATVTLEVLKGTATITWWPLENPITYPAPLTGLQLNAVTNGDGSIAYSSPYGTVLNAGTHMLTATFTPSYPYNYHPATATKDIIVRKAYPVVYWQGDLAITYGTPLGAAQLYATSPNAGTITYNPPAGTVLDAGVRVITATFTPDDTANYHTVSYQKEIAVDKQTTTVTWTNPAPIVYGTPLSATQLNATGSQPGTFAYTPSMGTVLNAGTHTLSVYFTPTSSNYYGGSRTVTLVVEKRTPVITWSSPAPIVYGTALSSTQLNATKDVAGGTLVYNPPQGTVLSASAGQTLTVTYAPASGQSNNYNPASATVAIDVLQLTPQISWTPATGITYGTPLGASQLNATSNLPGSFAYAPDAGTILPAGTNVMTATFTPTDTVNHATSVQTRQIVVSQATPVLTWTDPAPITYGTPLSPAQLSAAANVPGTFTYSHASGLVLPAGTHTLSVLFQPESTNYSGQNATVQLVVTKATPAITWANPAGITYGTLLSGTQLNATANVNGSFVYTVPAAGELNAGTHTLSVTFIPADGANYTTASRSVSITVAPAALTVRADDSGKVYGQALPLFTATGTGFVNGDSMASLGGALSFATTATATSAPGTYSVTPTGVSSGNYSITFAAGTLTITKAATSLALTTTPNPSQNNQAVQLRAVVAAAAPGSGTATGTVQFYENGTLLGSATLVNGVATINKSFKKGTHPLTATFAGDGNFTGSSGAVSHRVP